MFADITDIQTDTTSLMAFGTTKKNSHFYGVTKYFTKYVKHLKKKYRRFFFSIFKCQNVNSHFHCISPFAIIFL